METYPLNVGGGQRRRISWQVHNHSLVSRVAGTDLLSALSTGNKSSGLREMARLTKMRGGSAGSNKRSTRELTHRAPLFTPTTPLRDSPRTWLYPTSGIHQRSRNVDSSKTSRRATRKPVRRGALANSTSSSTRATRQQQPSPAGIRAWRLSVFGESIFAFLSSRETGTRKGGAGTRSTVLWLTELPPTRRSTRGANSLKCIPPES